MNFLAVSTNCVFCGLERELEQLKEICCRMSVSDTGSASIGGPAGGILESGLSVTLRTWIGWEFLLRRTTSGDSFWIVTVPFSTGTMAEVKKSGACWGLGQPGQAPLWGSQREAVEW